MENLVVKNQKKKIAYQIILGIIYSLLVIIFLLESLKDGHTSAVESNKFGDIVTSMIGGGHGGGHGGSTVSSGHVSTTQTSETISEIVKDSGLGPFETIEQKNAFYLFIRKLIGHFGFFFLLGSVSSLFYYSFMKKNKKWFIWIIINVVSGVAIAFISEFVCQSIAKGRTPSMKDVGIDSLGFIIATALITLIYFLVLIFKNKKKKENNLIEE